MAYSDLKNINKPVANFLFIGPTGVGKTEIAKVLAKQQTGIKESVVPPKKIVIKAVTTELKEE